MTKFTTFFGLKLSRLVFSVTEQLSVTLQGHDVNAQQAVSAAKATKEYLQRLRSHTTYEHFYKTVVTDSANLTDEPTLPRPKRYQEGLMKVLKVIGTLFQMNFFGRSILKFWMY